MTSSSRFRRWAAIALRIALGAVFAYAAWLKLRAPWQLFAIAILDYKVVPEGVAFFLARTLPWAELVIGIMLIVGVGVRIAATACSLLLAGFFALMVRAYALHMNINCGCFGPTGDPISWRTLLRDGTFLAASLAVTWIAFARRRKPAYK